MFGRHGDGMDGQKTKTRAKPDTAVGESTPTQGAYSTIRLPTVTLRIPDRDVAAATITNVTRRFGRRWALRGVTLSIGPGEVVGVEGHNGSGKSTLLRILSTAIKPTGGEAQVFGADVVRQPTTVRGVVAFLTHYPGLYDDLTAEENLRFACRMLGVDFGRVPPVLERVGLAREAGETVRTFSAGMQRRLSLARLLLQRPRLLLLDEPYNNFDPAGIALVNEVVREVRGAGGAAMIVLHDRHSAGDLLDRVVRLKQGVVLTDGPAPIVGDAQTSTRLTDPRESTLIAGGAA